MNKFKLQISTIENNILEFKKDMWFDCDHVIPLGVSVIRQFNSSECIVSKKVYLFGYGGVRYGIDEGISTMQDFLDYRDMHCIPYLVYDGCFITVDDKRICYGGGI